SSRLRPVRPFPAAFPAGWPDCGLGVFTIVTQVAPGQGNEHVLEAHVPRCQSGQRSLEAINFVKECRDCAMWLGSVPYVSLTFNPRRQNGLEREQPVQIKRSSTSDIFQGELDDVIAAQAGNQLRRRA